jgi:hypothetical protein
MIDEERKQILSKRQSFDDRSWGEKNVNLSRATSETILLVLLQQAREEISTKVRLPIYIFPPMNDDNCER